jgi:hypothetical protein
VGLTAKSVRPAALVPQMHTMMSRVAVRDALGVVG